MGLEAGLPHTQEEMGTQGCTAMLLVRRLISCLLVVIATSMITFTVSSSRRPTARKCCATRTAAAPGAAGQHRARALGYDQPLVKQYGEWAKGIFVGRTIEAGATTGCSAPCLGISFDTKTEVSKDLAITRQLSRSPSAQAFLYNRGSDHRCSLRRPGLAMPTGHW